MDLLIPKLAKVIHNLSQFALKTKEYALSYDAPILGELPTNLIASLPSASPTSSPPSSSLLAAVLLSGFRIWYVSIHTLSPRPRPLTQSDDGS